MAIIDGWTLPWPEIRIPLCRAGRAKLAALRTRRVGRRGGLQIFVVAAPFNAQTCRPLHPAIGGWNSNERIGACRERKTEVGFASDSPVGTRQKARIVARVVDDVGAEGREFAVERRRRLRNEVSTPDHAKA